MSKRKQAGRVRQVLIAGGAFLALAGSPALAEQVLVQGGRNVEVYEESATDAATVELVRPGQSLEVLGKTGKWLRVRTPGGKTGFVPEAAVRRKAAGVDLGALTGGPSASDMSASNAGRGLTPDAERYAQSRGYRTDAPDRIVALRQQAKPDLKRFKEEGNVGARR